MEKLDQMFNTKQVAEKLGISPGTLNNSRSTGTGIVINFCKIGSKVFYKKSDVDNYIEKHTYKHTGECL